MPFLATDAIALVGGYRMVLVNIAWFVTDQYTGVVR